MILWWRALTSYPQVYPQAPVDNATRRTQSLTDCQDPSLYLKYLVLSKVLNKDKKRLNKKYIKNLLAIPMSIMILTVSATTEAKAATQSDAFKLYAHSRIVNDEQYQCFYKLINKENRAWNPKARNGSHHGIGQMRNETYKNLDGYKQIDWTLRYIKERYGSMCNAWRFFKANGYH
jgi:hypothetical protein